MNKIDLPKVFQHALKEIDLEAFKGARELFFYPNIPAFLANRVKGEYSIPAEETVLMYRDMGFVADYPAGTVITNKALYIQNHSKQSTVSRLQWEDFKDVGLNLPKHTFVLVHKNNSSFNIDLDYFCPQPKFYKVFGYAIMPCICRVFLFNNTVDPNEIDTEKFIKSFPPLDNLCVTDTDAWIRDHIPAKDRQPAPNQPQQIIKQQAAPAPKQQQRPQPKQQAAPAPKPQQSPQPKQQSAPAPKPQQPTQQPVQQPEETPKEEGGSNWGKWALGLLAGAAAVAGVAGVVAATSKKRNQSSKFPPGTRLPNSQIVDNDGLVVCLRCNGFPMNPPCPLCGGRKRVTPEVSIQFCNQLMAASGLNPALGAAGMIQPSMNSRICMACAGTGRCGFCGGRGWRRILNAETACEICFGGGFCQNCMGRGII